MFGLENEAVNPILNKKHDVLIDGISENFLKILDDIMGMCLSNVNDELTRRMIAQGKDLNPGEENQFLSPVPQEEYDEAFSAAMDKLSWQIFGRIARKIGASRPNFLPALRYYLAYKNVESFVIFAMRLMPGINALIDMSENEKQEMIRDKMESDKVIDLVE